MVPLLTRHAVQVLRTAGHSYAQIAEATSLPTRTVRRVAHEAPVQHLDDGAERARRGIGRPSKTDVLRPLVIEILGKEPELMTLELLRRAREKGYRGGKAAFYDLVRELRPEGTDFHMRFEGLPGEFSQHDFGQVDVRFVDDHVERVHFFASRLKYLHAAWEWARKRGGVPDRDLALPNIPDAALKRRINNHHTPDPEEVEAVLKVMDGWHVLAIRLIWASGCRVGEIVTLRWATVDWRNGEIGVTGKTGYRTVPLAAHAMRWLREARPAEATADDLVLAIKGIKHARNCIGHALARACVRADMPAFSPHGLRRLAVDTLCRTPGIDVKTAAAILGHSETVMLKYYRKVNAEDKRRAARIAQLGTVPARTTGENVVEFPGAEQP
jgi:integrase